VARDERELPTPARPPIKPPRLRPGDTLAAVTLSWGGPGAFPHRYAAGKQQLEQAFGVRVVEMAHTLDPPEVVHANPRARAEDLMAAFADPEIRGIVSTIGGDDSLRILPWLDLEVIRRNPKVFLGYSDTSVTHLACQRAGLVTFYGPAIMAGFGENAGLFPYMVESVRRSLFSAETIGEVAPNRDGWTVDVLDWSDAANQARRRSLQPSTGWRFLQGDGVAEGRLLGGCLDVLEFLRGTPVWPGPERWRGAILFLETSEEGCPPRNVVRFLRSLAAMGYLRELAGILFARPGGPVPPERFGDYDEALISVVAREEGLGALPIVSGMDFGHTDPMFVLPCGVRARIDPAARRFEILESAVVR
jgi:muramoyltetrapeptide carboxypeptidase LdcA involved in peptidoglycan recycling